MGSDWGARAVQDLAPDGNTGDVAAPAESLPVQGLLKTLSAMGTSNGKFRCCAQWSSLIGRRGVACSMAAFDVGIQIGAQWPGPPLAQALQAAGEALLASIELPPSGGDWGAFAQATAARGATCAIVAPTAMLATPELLQRAVDERACNALLVKVSGERSALLWCAALVVVSSAGCGGCAGLAVSF
jgi:hypothetical protein